MARGTTLVKLLDDLRAETGQSLNPAHNAQTREPQVKLLQRVQERLWDDFNWPHLRVKRDLIVQAGQRTYDIPEGLTIERIERIELFRDGFWAPLMAGIGGVQYGCWNSDLDERSWPPTRWQITEGGDVEIWPIPDINADASTRDGYLRVHGIRTLKPLVADTDTAELDDRMIVLYAAGEYLARTGAKDAQLKLDTANRIYAKLRGGLTPRRSFRMFGTGERAPSRRMIAHYRPAGS